MKKRKIKLKKSNSRPNKVSTGKGQISSPPRRDQSQEYNSKAKHFYERGKWPALSFFGGLLVLIFTIADKSYSYYQIWKGAQIQFKLNNAEYGLMKPGGKIFFLIRGDIFNTGKTTLRVKEYAVQVLYNGTWLTMNTSYPPDTLDHSDLRDRNYRRVLLRKDFEFLEDYSQIGSDETKNGWIYSTIDTTAIPKEFIANESFSMKIICLSTDFKALCDTFSIWRQPRQNLRPY